MALYSNFQFGKNDSNHISLIRYSKTACGVDFLLNTADQTEKLIWCDKYKNFKTDFFEFFFFRKTNGYIIINGEIHFLRDNTLLCISPYQHQEWHVDMDSLEYTFLVFQEEFINNFLADKYFMYRLLYCYQNDYPTYFDISESEAKELLDLLSQMKRELTNPIADSYHMIVSELYSFLLHLNRIFATKFNLPARLPVNNHAFIYKDLLEKNIRYKTKVNDYASMMGISRMALNKAVENEFGVTATHLLKQRRLQEVKKDLIFSELPVKEISVLLGFSAPNHMMRFFKQLTGKTIGEFMNEINTQGFT